MTTFQDGPAVGQNLMLKRGPMFLRVTECGGKFDALDQLEDAPREDEKLFCYEVVGPVSGCHVRMSGGRGGFYTMATYKLVEPQPSDDQMRNQWPAWVDQEATRRGLKK